ncbi:MAG: hypothetical protein EBU57_08600 [Alphaproteobacteria bacterium]|nr:hypothetical protein [Alphaproteobacteria bacterium]
MNHHAAECGREDEQAVEAAFHTTAGNHQRGQKREVSDCNTDDDGRRNLCRVADQQAVEAAGNVQDDISENNRLEPAWLKSADKGLVGNLKEQDHQEKKRERSCNSYRP